MKLVFESRDDFWFWGVGCSVLIMLDMWLWIIVFRIDRFCEFRWVVLFVFEFCLELVISDEFLFFFVGVLLLFFKVNFFF